MGVEHFVNDEIHVLNTSSTKINPATEETLAAVLAAVDSIDLNVDGLEALVTLTNAAIAALQTANDASGDDIVTQLQTLETELETALSTLQSSNETHSDEVKIAVEAVDAAVDAFKAAFDARDLATEAKQDSIISELQDIELNQTDGTQRTGALGYDTTTIAAKDNPFPSSITDQASGAPVHVSHFGHLKTSGTIPIVFANFPGDSVDPTLWVRSVTGTGSITSSGGVGSVSTGASVSSSAILRSRKRGRFIAGQVTVYQSGVHPVGGGVAGNIREWGLSTEDGNDAMLFRLNGTDFEIVIIHDGAETVIPSASFSHQPGYTISDQNRTWRIEYSAGRALFFDSVGGEKRLLHTAVDAQAPLTTNLGMSACYRSENTTNSTNVSLNIRGVSISVWGNLPNTDLIFLRNSAVDGALPSGAPYTPTATVDTNPPANVIDTGYIPRNEANALFTHIQANAALTAYVLDGSDEDGTVVAPISATFTTVPGFPKTVKAPVFKEYVRLVIVNESGTDATAWYAKSRTLDGESASIVISLDAPIFDFFQAEVVQAVGKGQSELTGIYESIQTDGKGRQLISAGSRFSRLLQRQVENDEKLKLDVEPTNTTHYIGTNVTGAAESATTWNVIAIKLSSTKNPTDMEYVEGIAWDDRTNPTHWTFTP